jgi:hypothetical protein
MYQQLWGYKGEDKLYLGVREQKRLNTTALQDICDPASVPVQCKALSHEGVCLLGCSFFIV